VALWNLRLRLSGESAATRRRLGGRKISLCLLEADAIVLVVELHE